jgi:putative transposase
MCPKASALKLVRLSRKWGQSNILLVGRVRFRWTRPLPGVSRGHPGRLSGACLVKDPLGWHVCFRIEEPVLSVPENLGSPVGIDRGVVHTIALSTGEMLDMPSLLSSGGRVAFTGWSARQPVSSSSPSNSVRTIAMP